MLESDLNFCLLLDSVNDIWDHIRDHVMGACHQYVRRVKTLNSNTQMVQPRKLRCHAIKVSDTLGQRYQQVTISKHY